MDFAAIKEERDRIIQEDGPWSAHSVHLADGLWTREPPPPPEEEFVVRRITQLVADHAGKPLGQLRILDLACLEGLYGLELARHGATVVGIEGRAVSVRKAKFAQRALGLRNIEFHQDDVRNLSVAKYGRFDVILCLGILYHLDAPDVFEFIHAIGAGCARMAIVHTHIGIKPRVFHDHQGHRYAGVRFLEHLPGAGNLDKAVWGSLDNAWSFWLTRASLCNLLLRSGFTSVCECRVPWLRTQPHDHVTLVAIKGQPVQLLCAPRVNAYPVEEQPEHSAFRIHPGQKGWYSLARRYSRFIPGKAMLKRLLAVNWHRIGR